MELLLWQKKNTSLFYVELKGNAICKEAEIAVNEMTSRNKVFKKGEAQIKLVSWFLSQGKRTSPHLLFSLPDEMLTKIASKASNHLPSDKAEKIAADNFGRPSR